MTILDEIVNSTKQIILTGTVIATFATANNIYAQQKKEATGNQKGTNVGVYSNSDAKIHLKKESNGRKTTEAHVKSINFGGIYQNQENSLNPEKNPAVPFSITQDATNIGGGTVGTVDVYKKENPNGSYDIIVDMFNAGVLGLFQKQNTTVKIPFEDVDTCAIAKKAVEDYKKIHPTKKSTKSPAKDNTAKQLADIINQYQTLVQSMDVRERRADSTYAKMISGFLDRVDKLYGQNTALMDKVLEYMLNSQKDNTTDNPANDGNSKDKYTHQNRKDTNNTHKDRVSKQTCATDTTGTPIGIYVGPGVVTVGKDALVAGMIGVESGNVAVGLHGAYGKLASNSTDYPSVFGDTRVTDERAMWIAGLHGLMKLNDVVSLGGNIQYQGITGERKIHELLIDRLGNLEKERNYSQSLPQKNYWSMGPQVKFNLGKGWGVQYNLNVAPKRNPAHGFYINKTF